MRISPILGIIISISSTCLGQLPFELAPEELSNAEADFIDFVLSNPDLLFNNIDSETTTQGPTTSQPQITTTPKSMGPDPHTETGHSGTNHGGETQGNKDSNHGLVVENGVVRDPATGTITHVMDIHDGELIEVVQSEITGGHIIDPHTGEFILLSEIPNMIENAPEQVTLTVTTTTLSPGEPITSQSGQNPSEPTTTPSPDMGAPSGSTIINGVIRDPATGQITHIVDPHDGEHLEVDISPIFGAHVFDPHTGDLIIAEDHAMEFGTVQVQPKTSTEAPQPQPETTTEAFWNSTTVPTTTTTITTTQATSTSTLAPTITAAAEVITLTQTTTTEPPITTTQVESTSTEAMTISTLAPITETTTKSAESMVTTSAPVETTTKSEASQATTAMPTNEELSDHGVYINTFTASPPSGKILGEKQPGSGERRKFGNMNGISSVLDKYKSEYLKRRTDRNGNNTNVNINTVLKWIERRKNLFKKYLQEKKQVEVEKKQNPRKTFQVLDLDDYFPSLKRNKFGGLEARRKWRPKTSTAGSTSLSSGGKSESTNLNAGTNTGRANRNRLQNPFLKGNTADNTRNQPNKDRRNRFQVLMARKLENQRKKQTAASNAKVETTTPMVQPKVEDTKQKVESEKPKTDNVNTGKRRKFNNFFRNRRLLSRNPDTEDNVSNNVNKDTGMKDYLNSLKAKVNENTGESGQDKTPERYVAGLARKINNKIVARNPNNVRLRKNKWDQSYLANQ